MLQARSNVVVTTRTADLRKGWGRLEQSNSTLMEEVQMSDALISILISLLVLLLTFVLGGFVVVRVARKRGVRVRDLLRPGTF